ncbi:hypothetical protein AB0L97_38135 [Nocardia sp. NPDC051911]|uniref:hypothetical protein n=1 Tax=Nocardia sp. NPDC051911 TaxID=3154648 RepID=UPI00342B78F7
MASVLQLRSTAVKNSSGADFIERVLGGVEGGGSAGGGEQVLDPSVGGGLTAIQLGQGRLDVEPAAWVHVSGRGDEDCVGVQGRAMDGAGVEESLELFGAGFDAARSKHDLVDEPFIGRWPHFLHDRAGAVVDRRGVDAVTGA